MTLTAELEAFLDEHEIGVLATEPSRGHPHQSVVYYVRDGERLLISTVAGRHKALDVEATGWASLCVMGHERPFPSATLSGPARILTAGIGPATARIAQRISGADEPEEPRSDEVLAAVGRVILALTIEHVGPVSYLQS